MSKIKRIVSDDVNGPMSPKSIVASGDGVVIAQNMIYNKSLTMFDSAGNFLATIAAAVQLSDFGITGYPAGIVKGGPVELAFSPDKTKAYTSSYSMYGPGFNRPGDDVCNPKSNIDPGFVFRIDVAQRKIDQVIPVGMVPKYVATTPNGRYVLVTNWCSFDMSVIDATTGKEARRVPIGPTPRGIAVTADSKTAYVTVDGGSDVQVVNLDTFEARTITNVGKGPRTALLSPDEKFLYITLNRGEKVVKVDVQSGQVVGSVATGVNPRSMDISPDGTALYVANYTSNTMSKVRTSDMQVTHKVATAYHPIGVTYDCGTDRIWVCTYGGVIDIYQDS